MVATSTALAKKGAGADDDDPIERSLNERIKAGGVTQVVAEKKGTAKPSAKPSTTNVKGKEPKEAKEDKKAADKSQPSKPTDKAPAKEDKKKDKPIVTTAPKVMKGKKKNVEEEKKAEESV